MTLRDEQEVLSHLKKIKYVLSAWLESFFFFKETVRLGLGINSVDHRNSYIYLHAVQTHETGYLCCH